MQAAESSRAAQERARRMPAESGSLVRERALDGVNVNDPNFSLLTQELRPVSTSSNESGLEIEVPGRRGAAPREPDPPSDLPDTLPPIQPAVNQPYAAQSGEQFAVNSSPQDGSRLDIAAQVRDHRGPRSWEQQIRQPFSMEPEPQPRHPDPVRATNESFAMVIAMRELWPSNEPPFNAAQPAEIDASTEMQDQTQPSELFQDRLRQFFQQAGVAYVSSVVNNLNIQSLREDFTRFNRILNLAGDETRATGSSSTPLDQPGESSRPVQASLPSAQTTANSIGQLDQPESTSTPAQSSSERSENIRPEPRQAVAQAPQAATDDATSVQAMARDSVSNQGGQAGVAEPDLIKAEDIKGEQDSEEMSNAQV